MTQRPAGTIVIRALHTSITAFLISAVAVACARAPAAQDDDTLGAPIPECEAFLAAYSHCLTSLGPERIANARAEQARAGIAAQLKTSPVARTALQKQCLANLSQLQTSCK